MNSRTTSYVRILLFSICLPLIAATDAVRSDRDGTPRSDSPTPRAPADYVIQPQDLLRVHVFQHEDLNKQSEAITVSNDYTIFLPLIQNVNLKGKTRREAEEMIRAAYDKDYLVNPQVSIQVIKYADRSVNVVGQVNKPGRIPFPQEQGMTIVQALSEAGGPTRLADLKKVKLTRRNSDGETETVEINVDSMWNRGGRDARDATALQKDDTILVPERIL